MYSLIFAVSCFIFLGILILVYYSKQHFELAKSSIYKIMLYSTLFFIIFQIISITLLHYANIDALIFVSWRIAWSSCIVWYGMFYFYFISFITDDNSKNFFEFLKINKSYKIIAILLLISIFCYFVFLPFEGLDVNNFTFLPGKTAYMVYGFCLIINVFIIWKLFQNYKKLKAIDKIIVGLSIIMTILLMIFQMKYQNILIIPVGFLIEMYLLYFTIENPDLIMLKNTKKISDEVKRSNRVKLDFLSNVSYEIKNPMESISSLTDTLINTPFNSHSAKNYLKQICNSGSDLLDITNNILDLSTIESGTNLVKPKSYNISQMITSIVDIIKNKIGYSKIQFNVNVDTNIPKVLNGDESKIYQCVLNILTNAVKYTEIGKIDFSVTCKVEGNQAKLLFKVMDTGIGIKEEDSKYLFQKFARLDDAISKEIEGSGLGLAIAKKYLDLMGGKIWFESKYLAGSTFYIELSQNVVDSTPIENIIFDTKLIDYNEKFDYSKYKLLVVDDNELNVKMLKRLLERYNLNFDAVENGDKCITKIKSDEKYDLIFMDDSLPVISGTETMKILRKLDGELPPIVVLTANAILGMKEQYIADGFDDYLSKPIDMNELDRVINKYLNKK